jgi:ADP-ribose pyrophosphatase YjhB (NUDIX family)
MSKQLSLGVISQETTNRRTDYLYRISIKCLIRNEKGEVLVVKEAGRDSWDLPGGGMDHGENLMTAIAREMKEEVNLEGDFLHQVISVDEPAYLQAHDFWQVRLIFKVVPINRVFSAGEDSDEIAFMNPEIFHNSTSPVERHIYRYANILA